MTPRRIGRLVCWRHGLGSARTPLLGCGVITVLKPWRVDTFKISNDKRCEEKLVDVVGLYLNPPERAKVFCRLAQRLDLGQLHSCRPDSEPPADTGLDHPTTKRLGCRDRQRLQRPQSPCVVDQEPSRQLDAGTRVGTSMDVP
jgi:hypothetical protein